MDNGQDKERMRIEPRAHQHDHAAGDGEDHDAREPGGVAVHHQAPNGTGPPNGTDPPDPPDPPDPAVRLLRLGEVEALVRIKRSSIYRYMKSGRFPANIRINGASFWVYTEIQKHIAAAMTARDAGGGGP